MTWSEHADGVFSKRYQSLDLNIGAVVCDGGLLIVDTRAHHRQARELIEDLKEISALPVKWIVNTHHHWDHTFGNGEFYDVEIWGHERCKTNLADHGHSMLQRVKAMVPDQAEAFDEVLIVPPNKTITDAVDLTCGDQRVELRYLGRGHTDNDIVVRLPDHDVVFAGDLIENGAPPAFGDAYPLEWPDAATALAGLVAGVVVPGHGAPTDGGFVTTQAQELAEVAEQARVRHSEGMAVQEAAVAGGPFPEATLREAFTRAWDQLGARQ
jgi:glyoxylase-like metal-dependent hydrolase (beta-lactamase superfamily II)